ncbi:rod shape-determining protein MreD [Prevotella sp. P3-122]|uniref:rod shape-determining protein MreD n=1 Tax=Prevotella sp. P3-122 TaxID=2024223 RepID=UPI000B979E3B|nr:rod shape-determining protein MreD [Prevotella sp. P3-122]MCI7360967.1 rod shape-determining protein MreD [Prevotella sp.]MDD6753762.1 rod shape-determining protein MreD [Prevotella sp.]OYP59854.1 rod shape-determining protein MreD [Prevotella sp. P3-122]
MNMYLLSQFLWFVVMLVVQALLLNNIHLFGCSTPLLYVYVILMARRDFPRWGLLLFGFLLGLGVDMFSNTPGVGACSMTLLAFVQPMLMKLFLPRDSADDFQPGIPSLGLMKFVYFSFISIFLYSLVFFTLEMFNFFNWTLWALSVGGSTLLTLLLVIVIDNLRNK